MCYYETIYYLFLFNKIRYSTEEVFSILHSGNCIDKMQCLPVSLFSCTFHAPLPCQKRALKYSGKSSTHPEPIDLNHGLLISLQLLESCVVNASVERIFLFVSSFLPWLIVTKLAEPYRLWFAWVVFHSSYGISCFSSILFSFGFREESTCLAIFYLKSRVTLLKQNLNSVFQILQHLYSL